MTEALDPMAKAKRPMSTELLKDFRAAAGSRHVTEQLHVSILSVNVRIVATGEINVIIEEFDGSEWRATDTTPTVPGETVCGHQLRHPDFRVVVENPSEKDHTVSVAVKWAAPMDY